MVANLTKKLIIIVRTLNKKIWPYQYRVVPGENALEQSRTLEQFCQERFDVEDWYNDGLYFAFKREDQATLFLLRVN
jgi:hypothetical protein